MGTALAYWWFRKLRSLAHTQGYPGTEVENHCQRISAACSHFVENGVAVASAHILMNMWSPWIFLSGMVGLGFGEAYPYDGQCAVCSEKGCKSGVSRIMLASSHRKLWTKGNEEIQNCFEDNLKEDTPCTLSNGNLVLRTEQALHFEGKDGSSDDWKTFHSTNMSCADLNLPPSLKSSSGTQHLDQTNAPANPMTTPAPTMPPWVIATISTVCGSVVAVIVITAVIVVIYREWHKRRRDGQDGERPPDNTVQMDLLNGDDERRF